MHLIVIGIGAEIVGIPAGIVNPGVADRKVYGGRDQSCRAVIDVGIIIEIVRQVALSGAVEVGWRVAAITATHRDTAIPLAVAGIATDGPTLIGFKVVGKHGDDISRRVGPIGAGGIRIEEVG